MTRQGSTRIAVVGAGAFGGWTALHLLRKGADVALFDSWGPGNARASSGGETRVIRGGYGPDAIYVRMVVRSLELWKDFESRFRQKLYHRVGALWMVGSEEEYGRASLAPLREAGLRFDELSPGEAARRFPQIDFEGVRWAFFEHEAGYLLARRSCQAVLEVALSEGAEYRQRKVKPRRNGAGRVVGLELSDGALFEADLYVFACGPWLSKLFPDLEPPLVTPTRQEIFYFGVPPGDASYHQDRCPVWIDLGERLFYGIPGSEWRGFKVADDTRGPAFDPTASDRIPSDEALRTARSFLERRFPGLRGAPLLESRVCQYEQSPDGHFVLDRHPDSENLLIVGGGSGHGFKHAPAVGELGAAIALGDRPVEPFFSLARFAR